MRVIAKLSPSSSFSWAELALFSLSPTHHIAGATNHIAGATNHIAGATDHIAGATPGQVPIGLTKHILGLLSLAKASLAYLRLVKHKYICYAWNMTSTSLVGKFIIEAN